MKNHKMIILSLIISIAGVGFLFFESSNMLPAIPNGPLETYFGSLINLEGIVCRAYESKGHLFMVVKGDYEVEVPLFYGLRKEMSREPKLGDYISIIGIVEEVPKQYIREHWPNYSIKLEEPSDVEFKELPYASLQRAIGYSKDEAGKIYFFEGTVTDASNGDVIVDGVSINTDIELSIGDYVKGSLLIVEDQLAISNILKNIVMEDATLSPLKDVKEIGMAYFVEGRVELVKRFYNGTLLNISANNDILYLYLTNEYDVFIGDSITARGIFRSYYGKELLYVPHDECVKIEPYRKADEIGVLKKNDSVLVDAEITRIEYKGNHPILSLKTEHGIILCHIYSDDKENLRRLGKDVLSLSEDLRILACLEIMDVKRPIEAQLIDFIEK